MKQATGGTVVIHLAHNPQIEGLNPTSDTSGLYYNHITIVNDDSSIVSKCLLTMLEPPGHTLDLTFFEQLWRD